MRVKSMLTVGFLSLMAASAVVNVYDSFAADAWRVDVIGTLNERVAQLDSTTAEAKGTRVDVISNVASAGPAYPYTKSQ